MMSSNIANQMDDPIFGADDILALETYVSNPDTYVDALTLAQKILARANTEAVESSTDDVFALERLVTEINYQLDDDDCIDSDPLLDIIADCKSIIGYTG